MPLAAQPGVWAFGLALALPWLNPFTGGPWAGAVPYFASLACVSVLLWTVAGRPAEIAGVAARAWLCAALASSGIGLLQYFGLAGHFVPWINQSDLGQAFGNLRQRNQFATLTVIGLAALLLWPLKPGAGRAPWQWPAVVALAAGNAASSSRTGMLQLLLLLALPLFWRALRAPVPRRLLLVALVSYALASLALPAALGFDPRALSILSRLQDGGAACASRLVLWGNVLELIAQRPWLGWGWGELDYAHFITLYPAARFCDILDNAHNLPLHLAVELGLPLALLLCGAAVWQVWRARPWREGDPARQLAWAVLALILLHSMLEYPLWYGPFQIAAGLSLWILWSTRSGATTPPGLVAAGRRVVATRRVLAVMLLAGVAYAAWDYRRVSQIYTAVDRRAPAYRDNTLEKIRGSWLFRNQVRFAELSVTTVTAANGAHMHALASDLLHFSPEARVVEKLIASSVVLGRDAEAAYYLLRYRAAFPAEYARWMQVAPNAASPR